MMSNIYFSFTVTIKEFDVKNKLKKNIKEIFELEQALKNEFSFNSDIFYSEELKNKLPQLKFPKKLFQNTSLSRNSLHSSVSSICTASAA